MKTKREAYTEGRYLVPVPGVSTGLWGVEDWVLWIDAHGRWTVPVEDAPERKGRTLPNVRR